MITMSSMHAPTQGYYVILTDQLSTWDVSVGECVCETQLRWGGGHCGHEMGSGAGGHGHSTGAQDTTDSTLTSASNVHAHARQTHQHSPSTSSDTGKSTRHWTLWSSVGASRLSCLQFSWSEQILSFLKKIFDHLTTKFQDTFIM